MNVRLFFTLLCALVDKNIKYSYVPTANTKHIDLDLLKEPTLRREVTVTKLCLHFVDQGNIDQEDYVCIKRAYISI